MKKRLFIDRLSFVATAILLSAGLTWAVKPVDRPLKDFAAAGGFRLGSLLGPTGGLAPPGAEGGREPSAELQPPESGAADVDGGAPSLPAVRGGCGDHRPRLPSGASRHRRMGREKL